MSQKQLKLRSLIRVLTAGFACALTGCALIEKDEYTGSYRVPCTGLSDQEIADEFRAIKAEAAERLSATYEGLDDPFAISTDHVELSEDLRLIIRLDSAEGPGLSPIFIGVYQIGYDETDATRDVRNTIEHALLSSRCSEWDYRFRHGSPFV